jgi:hypothetical protein
MFIIVLMMIVGAIVAMTIAISIISFTVPIITSTKISSRKGEKEKKKQLMIAVCKGRQLHGRL